MLFANCKFGCGDANYCYDHFMSVFRCYLFNCDLMLCFNISGWASVSNAAVCTASYCACEWLGSHCLATWANYRNQRQETRRDNYFPIPGEFSEGSQVTTHKLDYWISFLVLEIRRRDGQCYPPNSLFNIVAGIQRHLRSFVILHFSTSLRRSWDCERRIVLPAGVNTVITVKDDKEFKVCKKAAVWVYGAKAKRFMLLCITKA